LLLRQPLDLALVAVGIEGERENRHAGHHEQDQRSQAEQGVFYRFTHKINAFNLVPTA
jgi:hypothetical protein